MDNIKSIVWVVVVEWLEEDKFCPSSWFQWLSLLPCLSVSGGSSRPSEDPQNRPQRNIFFEAFVLSAQIILKFQWFSTILHAVWPFFVSFWAPLGGRRGGIQNEPLSAALRVSCPTAPPHPPPPLLMRQMWHKTQENDVPTCPEKFDPVRLCISHTLSSERLEKKKKSQCLLFFADSESSCKRYVLVNSGVPCVDGSCRRVGYMIKMLKAV